MRLNNIPNPVVFLFLLYAGFTHAQISVSGKVFDINSKEPLPFVNIQVKGTSVGTTSDFDGNYQLKYDKTADSLVASYIGYKLFAIPIKKGSTLQLINIPMEPLADGISLEEVIVNPGENPAHRIIKAVIANKEKNNKKKLGAYQYEVYNKLEFDLNNIPPSLKDRKTFKPIKFVFDHIDSSNSAEKPFLPLFMIETLSDFYFRTNPQSKKEIIKASKITGVENQSISQVMGDMYQNINIYDNDIIVFGKNFKSPIAENAIFNYKFYLEDSLYISGHWCYHIRFKPKRAQELLFSGNMWVADTSFGLKRLEMSIPSNANINFIRAANVIQEYTFVDSAWMLNKDRLVIDFVPDMGLGKKKEKSTGVYGRKTTSYKDIIINQPRSMEFFNFGENVVVEEGATRKTDDFWNKARHDSLSANEKKIYKLIDTIQGLPIYRTWTDIITIIVSGYKSFGNFELGPYSNLFSYNRLEGPRFRFGGRTSSQFSRWYELSGYLAYGTKDEKWKYNVGFRTFLTKKPRRQLIGIDYKSDLEILGQSQNGFSNDNFIASFLRTTPLNSLTRVEQTQIWYEREWFQGFSNRLTLLNRKLAPVGNFQYNYRRPTGDTSVKEFIRTTEIRLTARFAFDEKFIDGDFSRTSLGTRYPILQGTFVSSLKHVYEGQYDYQKVVLNVNDRMRWGSLLGYTDYVAEAGKIWGSVPYPLMELHGGNQTYLYDYMAYNMMNFYEFASDQYASIWLFHHFEGLLFNKIPLLHRLKWREVVSYKILWGEVSESNRKELLFPSTLSSLNKGPYQEMSLGVENILRFFRVDLFRRLTYTTNNQLPWGIRAGFQLSF